MVAVGFSLRSGRGSRRVGERRLKPTGGRRQSSLRDSLPEPLIGARTALSARSQFNLADKAIRVPCLRGFVWPTHAGSSNLFAVQEREEHERQESGRRFHGGSVNEPRACATV
jgi:hypothetical protein